MVSSYRIITSATWLVVLLTLNSFAEGADSFVGSNRRYYSPNLRGKSRQRQLDHKKTSESRSKKVKEDALQVEDNTADLESNPTINESEQDGVVGNRVDETEGGEENEVQIPIEEAGDETRTVEVFKYVLRSEVRRKRRKI